MNSMKRPNRSDASCLDAAKTRFRERFQRSLKSCIKRSFSVEECFGQVWQETLEVIALTEQEEAELYAELLEWAKQWRR